MTEDVTYRRRGDVGEFLGGGDDDGFNLGGYPAVGVGYASFVFEVEHVPYSAHDVVYAQLAADVYCKSVIVNHIHSVHEAGDDLVDDVYPLFVGEEAAFVLVQTYGHGD